MLNKKKSTLLTYAGIAVLFLFSLCYSQMEVSLSGLEASRFAVAEAVGEQGVFHITFTQFRTADRIVRNGKVYSDKPLPLGWSAGVLHKAVHTATGLNFKDNYHLLIYLYNIICGGLVNILIFVWLFNHLRRYRKGSVQKKFLLALSAGLGSWLLSYSVTLNNHTPAALALLGWFIALEKFSRKPAYSTAVIAGLASGVVTCFDMPIGFFACIINLFVLFFAGKKDWKSVFAGACGSGAVGIFMIGLNYYAYQTVLPLYIAYGGGTYTPGTGNKSHIGYLVENLIGYRGLFSYQPLLFFAIPGLWKMCKKRTPAAFGTLAVTLCGISFYCYMTNEYGGAAYGFRYLIPLIPLLWYFAGVYLLEQKNKMIWSLAIFLILCGVISSLVGAYAPFGLAFEGLRTPPGHVTRTIRSSFTGNLLSWSYENAPDSFLTRTLRNYYGQELTKKYLFSSYLMQKKVNLMGKISQEK